MTNVVLFLEPGGSNETGQTRKFLPGLHCRFSNNLPSHKRKKKTKNDHTHNNQTTTLESFFTATSNPTILCKAHLSHVNGAVQILHLDLTATHNVATSLTLVGHETWEKTQMPNLPLLIRKGLETHLLVSVSDYPLDSREKMPIVLLNYSDLAGQC